VKFNEMCKKKSIIEILSSITVSFEKNGFRFQLLFSTKAK